MNQKKHRIAATLLALVMCLSLLPSAALAQDDYTTIQYFLGTSTARTLSQSEFSAYAAQYGMCSLTRVIQWASGNDEVLENIVLKGQKMSLTKPTPSANMTFGEWLNADGTVFSGSITKDTKIYLKETKASSYQVTFDLGGASGTAPAAQTVAVGKKAAKPTDPTWTGHKFLGWYTSSGTAWNFSTVVTSSMTLTAKWSGTSSTGSTGSSSGTYTVTLNANGGSGTYTATQTVAAGKTASLPTTLTLSGYYLEGWYDQNGKQYTSSTPITSNCTLTAKWAKDTFSFANVKLTSGTQYFNSTYNITKEYLQYLTTGETNSVRYATGETIEFREYIQRNAQNTWNGSCFGMAAVYCLSNAGTINANVFQSNARGLIDLPYPSKSTASNDLVNYYYLTQYTYNITKQFNTNSKLTTAERNTMIINALKATGGYVVLTFSYGKGSGHAVVATGYTVKNNVYAIDIWNPNYPTEEAKLLVYTDGTTPAFTSDSKSASTYNKNLKFTGAFTVENSASTYDAKNLQQYIMSKSGSSAATAKSTSSALTLKSDSSTAATQSTSDFAVLTTSVAAFSLTSEDGSTAVIEDGEVTSGDMDVERTVTYGGADDDTCTYFLEAKDAAKLEVDAYGQDADIQLLANGQYASVTANGLNSVIFDGTSVKTECKSATEQTISISSDLFGTTWNKVTVTGTDTALSVSPESGGVKVSSRNDISVSILGSNVDTQAKAASKTVAVNSSGTTVSTASGDMQADLAEVANPFDDVSSDAYYYEPVLWALSNGITSGSSDTAFSPSAFCTRAQAVTFLWRAKGCPEPAGSASPFTDVNGDDYFYKAVLWAVENNITSGTSDTTFSPSDTCTRAQAVTFLWRAAGSPEPVGSANSFTDVTADDYFYKAVLWALENNITSGTSNTTFEPGVTCDRAQIVTFLYRASDR